MARIQYFDDSQFGGYDPTSDNAGDYTSGGYSGSYEAPSYQPEAQSSPFQSGDSNPYGGSVYTPPNGNTGFSGYIPGGIPVPPVQQTQQNPFEYNAFRSRAEQLGGQYSGSLDDFVNNIFPTLSREFQGLERFGSKGDKIRLPNGEVIDAVISAGLGGRGYNWNPESPTSGAGYIEDPLIGQYIDRMNGLIDRLSAPQAINPTLQDAITRLQLMFDQPAPTQGAFTPLEKPQLGYTDQQRALLQTQVREPLVNQRDTAQQRALGRASSRGLGLGSGVLEQEAQGIDTNYDQMIGEVMRALAGQEIGMMDTQQARYDARNDAARALFDARAQAEQARWEQQRMGAAGQLAGLGSGLQGQELQALAAAMGGAGQLGQLPLALQQQQIAAMNALANQRIPQQDTLTPLIAILSGLAGQGENAYNTAAGQEGNFWGSLMGALPGILGAIPGLTGNQPSYVGDVFSADIPPYA